MAEQLLGRIVSRTRESSDSHTALSPLWGFHLLATIQTKIRRGLPRGAHAVKRDSILCVLIYRCMTLTRTRAARQGQRPRCKKNQKYLPDLTVWFAGKNVLTYDAAARPSLSGNEWKPPAPAKPLLFHLHGQFHQNKVGYGERPGPLTHLMRWLEKQ